MPGTWSQWFRREPKPKSRLERPSRATTSRLEKASVEMADRLLTLEEANRKLESINRIQQVEIDELTAVVARNLERVKAETRVLAIPTSDRNGLSRILSTEQEFGSHD